MTVPEEIEDFTPEELEAVEKMRARMKGDLNPALYNDTFFLYRFLKARDFNLNQAEIMLKKHLQWRKAKKVDTIIEELKPLPVLEKYVPFNHFGFNKEGGVCFYMPVSTYDVKGIHMSAKIGDMDNIVIRRLEMGERVIKERAKNKKGKLPGYVLIYELKDLSLSVALDRKGVEYFINVATIIQDNYPERLKSVLIINASHLFTFPFNILKKFIAPNVMQKIDLCGADGWKEKLLNLIDADELPAFLGGNRTDPDGNPLCESFINHAGPIPKSYHFSKNKNNLSRDPQSKKIVLPRASVTEIILNVTVPGSFIQWEFETKSKDVAFGLVTKDKGGDKDNSTELIPKMRLDTELYPEVGWYRCEKPGSCKYLTKKAALINRPSDLIHYTYYVVKSILWSSKLRTIIDSVDYVQNYWTDFSKFWDKYRLI